MDAKSELTRELKEFALELVDKIGIANAASFAHAPKGCKPTEHLPSCKSVVVFCLKHLDVFSGSLNKSAQAYSQDLTNRALADSAYRIGRFIEKKGFLAFPMVESVRMFPLGKTDEDLNGRIDLRRAAELSGLGRIGTIGIVVTPEYGPRVQLGAILTNADITPDAPLEVNPCIPACDQCVSACPSGAIEMPDASRKYHPVNQEKCMSYRKEHGGESPLGRKDMCSLCRAVCPVGRIA